MKYFYRAFLMLMVSFCVRIPLQAQHLDEVIFGNSTSETVHGLTTYNPAKVDTYTGQEGQTAKRFLPDLTNPYQGSYVGIYGGEISFVLRVDGTKQNYFTIKFGGDEYNGGRILLNVEGKEVGLRAGGDEEIFMDKTQDGQVISQGAFFFRTVPLPKSLTDGKKTILVRLRSTGRYYAYGTPHIYASYQRTLDANTCGVYRAYIHTNPLFTLPSEDLVGNTPNYSTLPATADDMATIRAGIIQRNEAKITSLLAGSNSIVTDPNNYYNTIEVLAEAYHRPDNSVAYHNPSVITKIRNAIDQHVINSNNGTILASSSWGGAFGRSAYGAYIVYDQLTGLDDVVDLGGGSGLTRRVQWLKIFKASFDFGVVNRRDAVTNQTMEAAMSVYGAALAMSKLDPTTYGAFPAITFHHVLEACGIEQFTGAMTNLTSSMPTLGNPASSTKAAGFYFMTPKGTSHEPGWVSPDCYGNLAPKIMEFFYMSKKDPSIITYGVGKGDMRLLDLALKHTKTQALFTYPSINNGKRSILSEGVICWRNTYLPGEPFYGNPWVAAETKDTEAIGYIKQMAEDGKLSNLLAEDPKLTWLHFLPEVLDTLATKTSTARMPSSPNQPDYVAADEENGVIAIKNGTEQLFVTLFSRAYAVNKLAKVHYINPTTERKIELRPDVIEYYRAGTGFATRPTSASGSQSGDAPDKPQSAYGGQQDPYVSYNRTSAYITDRQLLDFYQLQIGKYLVGMNTTKDLTKTIVVPASLVGLSAYDIATGNTITLTANMTLSPSTSKVYYIGSASDTGGLLADDTTIPSGVNKTSLNTKVAEMEAFATSSTTVANVSILEKVGFYRHNLFDIFIQKLALAKYASQYANTSQTQVDVALSELDIAYINLVGNTFSSVNPYERIEAESYSSQSGIQTENTNDIDGDKNLSFVGAGDYTRYNQVDFKSVGATKFYIRYAIPTTSTSVEIRTGSVSGPLVGKINLSVTGAWQNWATDSCKISGLTGIQDLFLVYKGAVNVNWFYFDSTAASYQSQVITFPALPSTSTTAADFDPNATTNSGLSITYTSSNTSVATIINGKIHIVGAGISTITASQEGNWTYNAANDVVKTLVVTGIAAGDYVSSGTMNWNGGVWNISNGAGGYSGTATTAPTASINVHILSGHTVTLATTGGNCKNLTVQSGGTLTETIALTVAGSMMMNGTMTSSQAVTANSDLAVGGTWTMSNNLSTAKNLSILPSGIIKGSTTAGGSVQSLNIGGTNTFIVIDGQLGGASTGTSGESIRMYTTGSGTITFTGSGKVFLARFQPNSSSAQSIIMDVDMNFNNFNSSPSTGFTLQNNSANSTTKSLTINAGKTLKLTNANCGFHNVYNASTAPTAQSGDIVYNVNGTLDVSATSFVFYSVNNTSSPSPLQNLILNVGSTGTLKLGRNVRMLKAMPTQTVAINVANGGVIDESIFALNLTITPVSSNGTSSTNSVWFSLAPNAIYKQLVSANVTTPFWIGTSNSSYNPVTVTPSTETIFTVGVEEGNVPSGLLVPSKALNRTWTITPAIASLTNLQFAYNDDQGNTDFNPFADVQLMNYNSENSTWKNVSSFVGPQSSTSTNKIVNFSGINSLGSFTLSNDYILSQNITFNSLSDKTIGDADFEVGATTSSGLIVSYSSSDTLVAKIVANKVHIVGVGTTTITASQTGSNLYNPATDVSQSLTVSKLSQSITFNALANKTIFDADFDAGATASSGLTVTYSSSDTSVAKIVANKIHIVGAGTTTIIASQTGGNLYNPATDVSQSLTVSKLSQSITFNALANKTIFDADFDAGALASSGLTVSYSSSDTSVAKIVANKIHIIGAGTTTITASQTGSNLYNPATDVSQSLMVISVLKVKYQDSDNNLSNNLIKPNLTIINEGSVAVPYSELTVRYWFTAENFKEINTWIDYAQLGNSKVKMKYVALPNPRTGAFGYIEYGFETSAGNLSANSNSGVIQSRFANTDWSNLSEGDDYSHINASAYTFNDHITLYRNGLLIYGSEPAVVPTDLKIKVYTQSKSSANTNTISTYLKINNEGNIPVNYSDLKVRYWFTKEGTVALNYYLDYALLGNSNIQGQFTSLSPVKEGADNYLEISVKPSVGILYPSSSTGNIQYRIAKTDWSNFNQLNDYSYLSNIEMVLNEKVSVYYQGQLIAGTEPAVISNARISVAAEEPSSVLEATMLGNPITGDRGTVEIKGTQGLTTTISLTNISGVEVLSHTLEQPNDDERFTFLTNKFTAGVYLLKVVSGNRHFIVKVIIQ